MSMERRKFIKSLTAITANAGVNIMNRNKVYVIQDIPGTREGRPKINIIGATEFGELKSFTT